MFYRSSFVCAGALLVLASSASASLIVDGTVNAGEYQTILTDGNEPTKNFYQTGFDMDTFQFAKASDAGTEYYWMAVTVVGPLGSPAIDQDGSDSSFDGQTKWQALFRDNSDTVNQYFVQVVMDGVGTPTVSLRKWQAGAWQAVALGAGDYSVAAGDALELRIATSKMPSLDAQPYAKTRLDDTGDLSDDALEGVVPEPATLGLMGLGVVAILAARRRRR